MPSRLQRTVAKAVARYVTTHYRLAVQGSWPSADGALLVLANHQNDAESLALPAFLALRSARRRQPFVAVASQRLAEPGFLVPRVPAWLRPLAAHLSLAPWFRRLNILLVENEPRLRSLASLAYEAFRELGDRPVSDVFLPEVVAPLLGLREAALQGIRLSRLWGARLGSAAQQAVTLAVLRPEWRKRVMAATRTRLEAQWRQLEAALRTGALMFLTPEGRITHDGRIARLGTGLTRLAEICGDGVRLAAVAIDPFDAEVLTIYVHFSRPTWPDDLRASLALARPLTTGQLLADAFAQAPTGLSAAAAVDAVRERLAALPAGVTLTPPLARDPAQAVAAALARMVRRGLLQHDGVAYRQTDRRGDPRMREAHDLWIHQANQYHETLEAAHRLPAAPLPTAHRPGMPQPAGQQSAP